MELLITVLLIIVLLIVFLRDCYCKPIIYERFNTTQPPFKIDIVYTWAGEYTDPNDIRSANNNELKYSIRTVMLNMPWVNKIFILMNPHKKPPSWFNDRYKENIILVDELETFPKGSLLPNKNSNAIETTLHNIPKLSEHFIYMNDDFFIGKPVPYTDFFTQNGRVVSYININEFEPMLQKNKSDILTFKYPSFAGWYHHMPIPYLKSYLKKYVTEYSDYVNWIRSYRTRKTNCGMCKEYNLKCPCQQLHTPFMFYLYKNNKFSHKSFKKGEHPHYFKDTLTSAVPRRTTRWVPPRVDGAIDELHTILTNPPKYYCINMGTIKVRSKINTFFEKMYPKKLYFEK